MYCPATGAPSSSAVRVRSTEAGRGWVLGLGRYSGDALEWFRIFSLAPRPSASWHRAELAYDVAADAGGREEFTLYAGHIVVAVRTTRGPVELAMSPSALTGLQAWLESAPPGAARRDQL